MKSQEKHGRKSSPRMHKAVNFLISGSSLTQSNALQLAGYNKKESRCLRRLNNLSKTKNRFLKKTRSQTETIAD